MNESVFPVDPTSSPVDPGRPSRRDPAATRQKWAERIERFRSAGVTVYTVEDASNVIWDAIHSKQREHIVGGKGKQLAFMTRYFPGLVRRQMLRQVGRRTAKAG